MVLPAGIVSSGAPRIVSTLEQIGIFFDPWQRDASSAILAQNVAGLLAADIVLLSIGRQVGKTFLVGGIVFADCIANPGTLTVWTAHRFKVARESFDELRALAESELMAPHIDRDAITTAAGNEVIPFRNGSRIVFAARERGSIRGFRKVRRLVLDEAQILTDAALSDLAPTQNQAANPQIILMGTPPKPSDPGEAFTRLRQEALSGASDDLLYVEFAAEPGSDPDDRAAWATANPSYPSRTPERAIMRLRRLLDDDDFLREVMGIWSTRPAATAAGAFPEGAWDGCAVASVALTGGLHFAVDVDPDREHAVIAVSDGMSVEIVDEREGAAWVPGRLVELRRRWQPLSVVAQATGGAASLVADDPGVGLVAAGQVTAACGVFYDAVLAGEVQHAAQPVLDAAVMSATRRRAGDGFVWMRRAGDVTALYAATFAWWAAHGVQGSGGTYFGSGRLDVLPAAPDVGGAVRGRRQGATGRRGFAVL